MKAMIFAAGLGTRLKPLTDTMPKALVPIAGKPLLQHTIEKLIASGFDEIIINLHHFPDQIIDFVKANHRFGIRIEFSDEREKLLDTGGATTWISYPISISERLLPTIRNPVPRSLWSAATARHHATCSLTKKTA